MKCPRCLSPLEDHAALNCPACGFNASVSSERHGSHWVRLERLTDAAHCLRLSDKRSIENCLDDFERRFPQVFLAIYMGVLPDGVTVGEVGFWLLNHAAFETNDLRKRNEFGIILAIDPAAGNASMSLGYCIEGLGNRFDAAAVLSKMHARLKASDYSGAIKLAIKETQRRLQKCGTPERQNPSDLPVVCDDLGVAHLKPSATIGRHQKQVS